MSIEWYLLRWVVMISLDMIYMIIKLCPMDSSPCYCSFDTNGHEFFSSACPAAVSIEVSRDGMTCIPICSPIQTSGLTLVKLQLLKSEVVTSVTVRLHKPRDSTTIGLSKIMLLGSTAFADSSPLRVGANVLLPSEDYVSKSRYVYSGWWFNISQIFTPMVLLFTGNLADAIV